MSSYRTIPIPNFLISDLEELYDRCSTYYGFKDTWFVFDEFDHLCETTLRDRKTKNTNCEKASVKQIRLHDFRLSYAPLLINKSDNVQVVAKYLGHTKIEETLKTYSHLFISKLDEIINVIDTLDK